MYVDVPAPAPVIHGLQLDMPHYAIGLDDDIMTMITCVPAKDLEILDSLEPQAPAQLRQKLMFNDICPPSAIDRQISVIE